jgi:hypothetical protein
MEHPSMSTMSTSILPLTQLLSTSMNALVAALVPTPRAKLGFFGCLLLHYFQIKPIPSLSGSGTVSESCLPPGQPHCGSNCKDDVFPTLLLCHYKPGGNSNDAGDVATADSDFIANEIPAGADNSIDGKTVSSFALFGELGCPPMDHNADSARVRGVLVTPCHTIGKQPQHSQKGRVTESIRSFYLLVKPHPGCSQICGSSQIVWCVSKL